MKNQGRTIIAIALGIVGIIIGAVVLIIIQRPADMQDTNATSDSVPTGVTNISEEITSESIDETDTSAAPTEESVKPTVGETLPPVTDAPEGEKLAYEILGEWEPQSAYRTETKEEVRLSFLYGTGFEVYGGVLEFRDNNTFSINIGITDNGDSNNGKYSCTEEKISVIYNNDREVDFIPEFNSHGSVEKILVPQESYTVVFVRK